MPREAEYIADIRKRLAHVEGADTPLFSAAQQQMALDDYDPAADAKGCYDLAIDELRKKHEAGQ